MSEGKNNFSQEVPPKGVEKFDSGKKESGKNLNEENIRKSAAYQKFLVMLKAGETDRERLVFFAYPDRDMKLVNKLFNGAINATSGDKDDHDNFSNGNGEIEQLSAQLLIKEIDRGTVKEVKEYQEPLGSNKDFLANYLDSLKKENKLDQKSPRQGELYDFLCQMHLKGMSREQMKQEFFGKPEDVKLAPEAKEFMSHPEWKETLLLFLRDLNPHDKEVLTEEEAELIKSGSKTLADSLRSGKYQTVNMRAERENPAARILSKILPKQLGGYKKTGGLIRDNFKFDEKLDQADWTEVSQALVEGLKGAWQNFYYSGKWKYGKEKAGDKEDKYYLSSETDTDAAAALYFFKKAGLDEALNATSLPHGKELPPGVAVDLGYVSGLEVKVNQNGEITVVGDNHQPGRGFETSTAMVFYNIFNDSGLFQRQAESEIDPSKKFNPEIGRALAQMTVDDDNANMINDIDQFLASKSTLRGLHRTMVIDDIYEFLNNKLNSLSGNTADNSGFKKPWQYNEPDYQTLLDTPLTKEELEKYDLWPESKKQSYSIVEARDWFYKKNEPDSKFIKKTDGELIKEGTLVTTKTNGQTLRWVVNLIGVNGEKRLKAGHDAVKVNGFDGLISYNPARMIFMVNTVNKDIDLSKGLPLKQGVPVRGAMVVKPMDGRPLEVSLKDILDQLAPSYVPQGKIKDYLEGKELKKEIKSVKEPKVEKSKLIVEPITEQKEIVKTEKESVEVKQEEKKKEEIKPTEAEKLIVLEKTELAAFEYNGLKFSRELLKKEKELAQLTNLEKVLEQNLPRLKEAAAAAISKSRSEYVIAQESDEQAIARIVEKWKIMYREKECQKLGLPVVEGGG